MTGDRAPGPVHVSRRPLSPGQRIVAVPIVGGCLGIIAAGRLLDRARSIARTLEVAGWLARRAVSDRNMPHPSTRRSRGRRTA